MFCIIISFATSILLFILASWFLRTGYALNRVNTQYQTDNIMLDACGLAKNSGTNMITFGWICLGISIAIFGVSGWTFLSTTTQQKILLKNRYSHRFL